jgi:fructosamine-3-kinase
MDFEMALPKRLAAVIAAEIGIELVDATPVGGGSISNSVRGRLADGQAVLVKWHSGALPALFETERRGLELLRATETLRVPAVLAQREASQSAPAFIVLEWLGQGASTSGIAETLGRGLAALHRVTATHYGLDHDNYIGANPQPNRQHGNWVAFFREQRLGFQMELAHRNGYLTSRRAGWLEKLLARLDNWLPQQPPASLLHGDLWGGNWLTTASDEPALIDPAVYYGHREAELAFTELFGGFPAAFYRAYQEAWPLETGFEERKDIYNLYHLLNHLNLFGEGYGGAVDAILRRYF